MKPKAQHTVKTWQLKDVLLELYLYVPGTVEPLAKHSHQDYQIGFSLDANGGYFYRGTRYPVPRGSFSILHPGEVHTTTRTTTQIEISRTFWMLYIKPSLLQSVAKELTSHPINLPFFKTPVINDSKLTALLIQFHQAVKATDSKLKPESLLLCLLGQLLQRYADMRFTSQPFAPEYRQIAPAREYLEAHLSENVSLKDLAQIAELSPYHLNRLFRQVVGIPPHQYQIQARIARAKTLLHKGMPLKKIAKLTGFADQSHLTRHFKKFVHVTPGRYLLQK